MIKTINLSKVFRTEEIETTALNQINLEIQNGEFVAIMGESGCGKSTFLNTVGLLDSVSSGQLIFNGTDVSQFSESQRAVLRKKEIGFIFQSFNLIDELTVFENVELPLTYQNIHKSERKKMVTQTLERVNMLHRENHFPLQLSGGQQQRVAIARAIVHKPHLLLADEPTGNLDSKNGTEVMELLTELNQDGSTIIMVTHSEKDADHASRKIHLHDGALIESPLNIMA
ncbi:ABC transporter ATP-binding protein [bacterium SCSIO 12643]|nr:ABC transporter ATP-binding protein [bacterium SCSIO 12643]